jgi:hypothetical protein
MRLQQKSETLTVEKSTAEAALTRIDELYQKLGFTPE